MQTSLALDQQKLSDFCRRHRIRRLSLFGSVLTDHFGPDSDVDMLVEFKPDARVSLLDMAAMERELTALVQRPVDLRTPKELSRHFRDEVLAQAEVQYAAP